MPSERYSAFGITRCEEGFIDEVASGIDKILFEVLDNRLKLNDFIRTLYSLDILLCVLT